MQYQNHYLRVIIFMILVSFFAVHMPAYAEGKIEINVSKEKFDTSISKLSTNASIAFPQKPNLARRLSRGLSEIKEASHKADSNEYQRQVSSFEKMLNSMNKQKRATFFKAVVGTDEIGCSSGCVLTNCSVDCSAGIPQCECGSLGLFGSCKCIAVPQ